jgi:penicillin-binding protein 1A
MAQRNRRRQRRRGGIGGKLALLGGTLFVVLAFGVFAIASWVLDVAADAPSLAACKQVDRTGNSVIYAGDGSKLGLIDSDEARDPVSIERIPQQLQLATVAIEDQRFYEHGGVDPEGILRAAVKNLEAGKTVEGGSTITQQLVRHLCLRNPKRDLERKIIEAKLAIEYAEKHSRVEILDQYLNTATYGTVEGSTTVGVGAAAQIYFSKPVSKLSLEQSALLAGLPQAPSEYNPILHPGEARQRRNSVLTKMAHLGYLSPERAREAEQRGLELDVSGSYFAHREPFFFDYVEHELIERYGAQTVREGGIKAYTTIQPRLQQVGLEAMSSALPYSTDPSSALVSINPDNGEIESMVSSSSYDSSQFNLAAQGHRQPGSTFKAFVLTTAIKQGIDPYTTYYTSKPLDLNLPKWGHWEVHTADEGYLGRVNLQQATVASDVFAQLDLDVGPERVAATAKSMGITSPLDGIPAEGIGGLRVGVSPLEMADAYATLANGGIHHDPVAIKRVVFPAGRTERPGRKPPRRVISEAVAYEVTRLLHDNITEGTGTAAYTGCPGQAGKTGTTDRETDAWFAGYQPNLTTVVWVGYPQSNAIEMTSVHGITVFGGTFPAEIWHSLYAGAEIPCEEFEQPKHPISWAPYFGHFTAAAPRAKGAAGPGGAAEAEADRAREIGEEVTGGYNPDAYAPGAGQKPTPVPPPPPAANVGGGGAAEEAGSK